MARSSTVNADGSAKLAITNQFRDKGSMVYDFAQSANRLMVRISPRQNEADPGDYRVEASEGAHGEVFVSGWGKTRAEALAAVGVAWRDQRIAHGMPEFDWAVVTSALETVRALR